MATDTIGAKQRISPPASAPRHRRDVERDFMRALTRLSRSWRHALDHALRGQHLSEATASTLLALHRLGEDARQTDLAAALDISSASLVRLIDALAELGYVGRVFDRSDRRVRRIHVTDAGQARVAEIEATIDAVRRSILSGLAGDELAITLSVVSELGRALDASRRP